MATGLGLVLRMAHLEIRPMTNDDIFHLAEKNGYLDDFGRWNFKDEGLLDFVHELRQAIEQAEKQPIDLDALGIPHGTRFQPAQKVEKQDQKTPLKVLNLTVFTENRLRNGRVYDVETLQAMTNRDILAIPDMGKKALGEVLEALDVYAVNISQERVDETAKGEHEPVGYINGVHGGYMVFTPLNPSAVYLNGTALYLAPPKREWVGLTHEERDEIDQNCRSQMEALFAIEAKLKEKNT